MDIVKFRGFKDPTKYTTKDKKFEQSVHDYITIATKLVSKFCTTDLRMEILRDEDALSSMANALMMADWRWKKDYNNKNQTVRTQYSYRTQCLLWEVKSYLNRKVNVYNKKFKLSLNYSVDAKQMYTRIIDSSSIDPIEAALKKEEHEIFNRELERILTRRERICVTMYYLEKYTYKEIGKKFDLSKERIRQIICFEAMPKLQKYYKDY